MKEIRKSNPENFTKEMKRELQECEDRLHENLFDAAKEETDGTPYLATVILKPVK